MTTTIDNGYRLLAAKCIRRRTRQLAAQLDDLTALGSWLVLNETGPLWFKGTSKWAEEEQVAIPMDADGNFAPSVLDALSDALDNSAQRPVYIPDPDFTITSASPRLATQPRLSAAIVPQGYDRYGRRPS